MKRTFFAALAGSSLATVAFVTPAMAQNAPAANAQAQADEGEDDDAIVVTGTQIRGIAPVGANVIGFTSQTMKSTGLADSNQILAQLPQSNFFNMFVEPGNGGGAAGTVRIPLTKPNLRNLPVGVSGTGALTLVLMDGHRVVPGGIEQSVVDAGIVPPGMLDRLEVILDGASAVYGSDAVGGVLNYITRKRFDGIDVNARYGIADDYWQTDISATVGKTWGSGGISVNYEFAKNSILLRGDRDHQASINWVTALRPDTGVATGVQDTVGNYTVPSGPPAIDDLTCDVPNVRNNAQTNTFHVSGAYTGPGTGLAPNPQFCDSIAYRNYLPASRRHSVFVVLQQDLSDAIKVDVTGFYVNRLQVQNSGPAQQTVNPTPSNPFYRCVPALTTPAFPLNTCTGTAPTGTSYTQRVSFSYGPLLGNDFGRIATTTEAWQITPTITADLGSDWQARASFSYGWNKVTTEVHQIDTTLQGLAVTGTAPGFAGIFLNPYDIASTNVGLVNSLVWDDIREGRHIQKNARLIADGPVFKLPGGDVRVAVGAEWLKINFERQLTNLTAPHNRLDPVSASETSKSVFGELVVPVFGDENGFPGMESLVLSASGRYDDYGQGINTFNPKLAVTYQPFDWVTFRASWGTSFRAPNAVDKLGETSTSIRCIGNAQTGCSQSQVENITNSVLNPATGLPYPNYNQAGNKSVYLTLGGTSPGLTPETSTGWSVGADIKPPLVPGLTLSATYWHIDFKNIMSLTQNNGSNQDLFRFLPAQYIVCRTSYSIANQCGPGGAREADFQNFLSLAAGSQAVVAQTIVNSQDIVYATDTRIRNLGQAKVTGVDASVNYRHEVGFGSIDLGVNAAWLLQGELSFFATAPFIDQIAYDTSKFRLTARLGATVGNFRAQATLRHQAGFTPRPQFLNGAATGGAQRDPSQTHIPAFDVIDLSFVYDVNGDNLFQDLSFSLNINNVLDVAPPLNKTAAGGTAGGFNSPIQTIGRFIQFGVSKRF